MTISEFFNTSKNGLPGNDGERLVNFILIVSFIILPTRRCSWPITNVIIDSGAMGSYAFFYLAGMYPLPATKQFLISSPYFPSISFHNPFLNTTTTIKAEGFSGNGNGTDFGNVYVKVRCLLPFFILRLPGVD
jgi:hypothetical protein